MTLDEMRKEYQNSPDFVKTFNTLIDVIISNFYTSKDRYDEVLELGNIQNLNYSYKPEIKKWHITLLEMPVLKVIYKTHSEYECSPKLKKEYKTEFDYLCVTMADLKQFIHSPQFTKYISNYLDLE